LFDKGLLHKQTFSQQNVQGIQGFIVNTRKPYLSDWRIRRAMELALDFDWLNRQLFFNSYESPTSFWNNSELGAYHHPDKPSPDEERILRALQTRYPDSVPERVFGPLPVVPTTNPPHTLRDNLKEARTLLQQAGWHYDKGVLKNAKGDILSVEFLESFAQSNGFSRVFAAYFKNLTQLGFVVKERDVDFSLYSKRVETFDFDIISAVLPASINPGNELKDQWGSQAAKTTGSDNYSGLSNPAVDALIQLIINSNSREETITATSALDRLLLHEHLVIPQWINKTYRVGYHSRIIPPKTLPLFYKGETWPLWHWSADPTLNTTNITQ
jgi:microcin C transport system substrate-binding protein